jgi:hypothetical protein
MSRQTQIQELTDRQQYWLDHVRAIERNGGSVLEYAASHGISTGSLYYWRRWATKRRNRDDTMQTEAVTAFQRIAVRQEPATVCRVKMPNGAMIELAGHVTDQMLQTVIRAAGAPA